MQQYVIIARDETDSEALARRLAVRSAHLEVARRLRAEGNFIEGGAILNDRGEMIGSVMIVAFSSRAEFDAWFESDPYVTGGVWQSIEVQPFRCAQL